MQVFWKQGASVSIQETQQGPHQAISPAGAGWEAVVDPGSLVMFALSSCSRLQPAVPMCADSEVEVGLCKFYSGFIAASLFVKSSNSMRSTPTPVHQQVRVKLLCSFSQPTAHGASKTAPCMPVLHGAMCYLRVAGTPMNLLQPPQGPGNVPGCSPEWLLQPCLV